MFGWLSGHDDKQKKPWERQPRRKTPRYGQPGSFRNFRGIDKTTRDPNGRFQRKDETKSFWSRFL